MCPCLVNRPFPERQCRSSGPFAAQNSSTRSRTVSKFVVSAGIVSFATS
jgi:hypothetical protein